MTFGRNIQMTLE